MLAWFILNGGQLPQTSAILFISFFIPSSLPPNGLFFFVPAGCNQSSGKPLKMEEYEHTHTYTHTLTHTHTHARTHARTHASSHACMHAQNIKSVKVCRPRRQNTPRCVPVVSDNVTVIRCPLCLNLVALLVIVLQHCWSGCRKIRRTANINTESKFRSFAVFLTLPSYQPNPWTRHFFMMTYHETDSGCNRISTSAGMVKIVFWLFVFNYISPHCDFDLENSKSVFSLDNPTRLVMTHQHTKSG